MSLIKDALEFLRNEFHLTHSAKNKFHTQRIDETDPGRTIIIDANGSRTVYEPPAPARSHVLHRMEDMPRAISWAYEKANAAEKKERLALFYDHESAILIMDDASHRQNKTELNFETTDVWDLLRKVGTQKLTHKQLMRLIRLDLAPYFPTGKLATIIEPLKVLDFDGQTTGSSTAMQNRTGFGKTVEALVQSKAGPIPDEILVNVPIYRDPLLKQEHPIRLVLEIDPDSRTFELLPYPEDLDSAWSDQMAIIGNMLRSYARQPEGEGETATYVEMCPVFYGRP